MSADNEISALDSIHDKLFSSLEVLTKEIKSLIGSQETEKDEILSDYTEKKTDENLINKIAYSRLKCLAKDAHKSILDFGLKIEMGIPDKCDLRISDPNQENVIKVEKRMELQEIGRSLWMTIRSHPEHFRDAFLSMNKSNVDSKKKQNIKKGESNGSKEEEEQADQATASGYIRAIAARLILIDYIITRNCYYPTLRNVDCFESLLLELENEQEEDENSSEERKAQCSTKKIKIVEIDRPSKSEIEFGIKSFVRAGRSLLAHSSDPESAYINLNLARMFWCMAKDNYIETVKSNIDEGFDVYALLPEAASLLITKDKDVHVSNDHINNDKNRPVINSFSHISSLLMNVSNFIEYISNTIQVEEPDNYDKSKFRIHSLRLHRFLPSLARISYKHGSRFARLNDFENSRQALKIALKATDKCIAEIRSGLSSEILSSSVVKILEEEMLSVSKECFYVLSHVCLSTGKNVEAKKCLDQIESYIDEQRNRDDNLFKETMNRVDDGNVENMDSSQLNFSEIALEGPKKQDMADIRARAITARSKARHCEDKERANLTYSRIMIEHRSNQPLSLDQETYINTQLKKLIEISLKLSGSNKNTRNNGSSIATGSNNIISTSTLLNGMDNDPFYLALVAIRHINVRRLSALVQGENSNAKDEHNNTYDFLKSNYSKDNSKYLLIALDELSSTITCIHSIQGKKFLNNDTSNKEEMDLLNARGIKVADNFVKNCHEWMKSLKSKDGVENSILAESEINQAMASFITLLHDAKGHCVRAISLYRESESHEICVKYSECCLEVISIIGSASKRLDRSSDNVDNYEDKDMKYFEADIMAMKAYSLTKSKQYMRGKICARDAWDKGLSKPKVCNMVVLFHCTVAHETKEIAQDLQKVESTDLSEVPVSNSLLELDNAIKYLMRDFTSSEKSESDDEKKNDLEILSAFPCLIEICKEYDDNGKGLLLLGVQERQISMLTRSKFVKDMVLRRTKLDLCEEYFSNNGSILSLLLSYLSHVEYVISGKDILNYTDSASNILDAVMSLLCSIRERKKHEENENKSLKNKKSKQANESILIAKEKGDCEAGDISVETNAQNLIWDDEVTKKIIGSHRDCVMIAEQLWNLAVITMTSDKIRDTPKLFAHAHDFALLSEEEENMENAGECLTKGKLDFDIRHTIDEEITLRQIIKDVDNSDACELSSEFSAQCLLLSASSTVDHMYHNEVKDSNKMDSKTKQTLKYSVCRLKKAKQEFLINYEDEEKPFDQLYFDKLYSLLMLRLLIEICDDEDCSHLLQTENILHVFSVMKNMDEESNVEQDEIEIENSNTTPCITALDNASVISHLYLCSKRAETNNLSVTSRSLLRFCSRELGRNNKKEIKLEKNKSISLGKMQQKLVRDASTVGEVLEIFKDVEKSLISSADKSKEQLYALDELDWFAVEAYNRGLSLSFMGDSNAQDLLAIALNILPKCGKEVQSYGPVIRKTYHDTMDHFVSGSGTNTTSPMSTENVLGLFTGMP